MHSDQILYLPVWHWAVSHLVHLVHVGGGRAELHLAQPRARPVRLQRQRPHAEGRRPSPLSPPLPPGGAGEAPRPFPPGGAGAAGAPPAVAGQSGAPVLAGAGELLLTIETVRWTLGHKNFRSGPLKFVFH